MPVVEITQTVDARGLSCPMPIVRTAQAVEDRCRRAPVIELLATDAGSIKDVAAWCRATGNELDRAVIGWRGLPLRHPPEVRPAMTTETLAPFDPLAEAIAAVDGWPEVPTRPSAAADRRARDAASEASQGPPDHRLQR